MECILTHLRNKGDPMSGSGTHTERIYRREKALYLIKCYIDSPNSTGEQLKLFQFRNRLAEFALKG